MLSTGKNSSTMGSGVAEQLLPIPEIWGSNPVNSRIFDNIFIAHCWKDEKEAGNGPLKTIQAHGLTLNKD